MFFPDYMQVLKEMNRVLKPGGIAVCFRNIPANHDRISATILYVLSIYHAFNGKNICEKL